MIGNELTDGKDPCYISTNGKVVMTANYSSGNVTEFPVGDDGALKPHDFLYRAGLLSDTGRTIVLDKPVCIVFV